MIKFLVCCQRYFVWLPFKMCSFFYRSLISNNRTKNWRHKPSVCNTDLLICRLVSTSLTQHFGLWQCWFHWLLLYWKHPTVSWETASFRFFFLILKRIFFFVISSLEKEWIFTEGNKKRWQADWNTKKCKQAVFTRKGRYGMFWVNMKLSVKQFPLC